MARNDTFIGVPPERVFEQLADAWSYARWVAGTKEIRGADEGWPAVGSQLQVTIQLGPIESRGVTTVEDVTPPWQLTLRADAGLLGAAIVSLRLRPDGRGTRVTMVEDPEGLVATLNPVVQLLVRLRNAKSLQRLRGLAESQAG